MYIKPSAKKALKQSIRVWQEAQKKLKDNIGKEVIKCYQTDHMYTNGKDNTLIPFIYHGKHECPLCKLFHFYDCKGCPIYIKTNKRCCYDTPFKYWTEHDTKIIDEATLKIHQDEIDFLIALNEGCKVKGIDND
jgi:hypothetical protein